MPRKNKIEAAAKQKQQRQKIFVIVGGVLLVLVFGYEAMSLGLLGGKKAPPAAPVVQAPPLGAPNALTPPGLPGATSAAPAGELADTDVVPSTAPDGQLVSFSMFETKNPFTPQIRQGGNGGSTPAPTPTVPASGSTSSSAPSSSSPSPSAADAAGRVDQTPTVSTGSTVTPSTSPAPAVTPPGATTTPTTTTPAAPAAPGVTIAVNGHAQKVGKDGTFPTGAPVFRLVSFADGTAEVAIVGGSYQTGDPTLTLERGKPVTLMNTSDGKRYKLELL